MAAVLLTACATAPQHAIDSNETLLVVGSVDPEFRPSWAPAGIRWLQYARMVWVPAGGGIAASVHQGPYVVLVDEDHSHARLLSVSPRGADLVTAWLPGTDTLMVEGLDIGSERELRRTWYTSKADKFSPLPGARRRPESVSARGVRLPNGDDGFIAIEEAGVAGVDRAPPLVVRASDGVEQMHIDPFPPDGASRRVIEADFQQAGGRVVMLVAVHRVTRPGGMNAARQWIEPIEGHDLEVFDVSSRKTLCRLTFEDDRSDGHAHTFDFQGIALSPDTRFFVVNTTKGTVLHDVDGCRPLRRLQDDRDAQGASGKWISFTGDGRYVIRDGADVRSGHGGFLDVWRVSDARHVVHVDTDVHNALAVKPGSTDFAAGRDDGQITFFRIGGGS